MEVVLHTANFFLRLNQNATTSYKQFSSLVMHWGIGSNAEDVGAAPLLKQELRFSALWWGNNVLAFILSFILMISTKWFLKGQGQWRN